MAESEEKVMRFVEKTLEKDPQIETSELFAQAKKVDASVENLSLRQFNARYPLQIKRRKSMADPSRRQRPRRRRRRSQAATAEGREAVRQVFLRFASDLSAAEERKELVGVIARVDSYVDEAMQVLKG
ncbi:MAG: hypothetical protein EA422_14005 [Gemmatimonadales bacterium]|nr:MAG: hypothetical protein EA422_14005 [Gemmatimonadales bacterium]